MEVSLLVVAFSTAATAFTGFFMLEYLPNDLHQLSRWRAEN